MSDIQDRLRDCRDMLVIDYSRMDGVTSNRFRLALRDRKISTLTVKNSLAQRALNDAGVTALDPILRGPSTLVWGAEDIVALSKEIAKWTKEIAELEIKGGTTEGATLQSEDVDQLSKSPGREELIGQVVGLALSPGTRLAGALLGPGGKIAAQVKTIAEKTESA